MKIEPENFLNKIFDVESKRILNDIKDYTPLKPVIEGFNEEQNVAALSYIVDVFKECFEVGDLKVHIEVESSKLKAYAMYFIFHQTKTIYLHFLWVNSEFRKKGLGKSIVSKFKTMSLIRAFYATLLKLVIMKVVVLGLCLKQIPR
ncbi:GNAT family N-acetyltransferase [Vibrio penaeicida]|uniref:N-acetyltransferase domain-containing protein n=1 Tax=Vibrio penaeicida TaxID=104609 RepID=A0AAV5P0E2_9VIBR|nr:GNAT family N-acetyltransferase [Vibrio penaeicida]RTZ19167.1 GNAT family N-acetyltransferase [Vibrio penaeicida]GLQ76019.1 hypothetical protein GCM10007932_53820 [Vibrio penaeicida]